MAKSAFKDKRREGDNHIFSENNLPNYGFVGQNVKDVGDLMRNSIVSENLAQMSAEINVSYPEKSFMSFDGLVRPISVDGGIKLPQFAQYENCSMCEDPINQDDLNPFTNPSGLPRSTVSVDRSETIDVGHDIELIARSGVEEYCSPSGGLILRTAGVEDSGLLAKPTDRDYRENYRPFALRAPIVITGWCYDMDDKPMPNQADNASDAAQGIYTRMSLTDKFLDNHLQRPDTWVTAPIDLRFDRDRGVYTSSCEGCTIMGIAKEDIPCAPESGMTAGPVIALQFTGVSGYKATDKEKIVFNPCGDICAGALLTATKICGRYVVINVCHTFIPECPEPELPPSGC